MLVRRCSPCRHRCSGTGRSTRGRSTGRTGSSRSRTRPRVPLDSCSAPTTPSRPDDVGRPVTVAGTWLPRRDGAASPTARTTADDGFWVVVTVAAATSRVRRRRQRGASVVLGWTVEPDPGRIPADRRGESVGWLPAGRAGRPAPTRPGRRRAARPADRRPARPRLDHDLYSGYVILDSPAAARGGLEAVTPDSLPDPPTSTALRNLLYGIAVVVLRGLRGLPVVAVEPRRARVPGPGGGELGRRRCELPDDSGDAPRPSAPTVEPAQPAAAYRVMATIVGVLLVVLCLIGLPLHWAHLVDPAWFPVGSDGEQLGRRDLAVPRASPTAGST